MRRFLLSVIPLAAALGGACAMGGCGGGGATPAAGTPTGPVATPAPKESVPLGPSKLLTEVQALGIDLSNPGVLSMMNIDTKTRLMRLFTKALGVGCEGCHVSSDDFKTDTRNKKLARAMWNNFVHDLRDEAGGPIFCDTCHQGRMKILARDDDKILAKFMTDNYKAKLTRADKAPNDCESCHGKPFEADIFKNRFHVD